MHAEAISADQRNSIKMPYGSISRDSPRLASSDTSTSQCQQASHTAAISSSSEQGSCSTSSSNPAPAQHGAPHNGSQHTSSLNHPQSHSRSHHTSRPGPSSCSFLHLLLLLLATLAAPAARAATKWTILVYLLADNDLECFGILNLQQLVVGMGMEPPGCVTTACGGTCGAGFSKTSSSLCLSVGDDACRAVTFTCTVESCSRHDAGALSCTHT